jgi:hypothetical protein
MPPDEFRDVRDLIANKVKTMLTGLEG